MIEHDTRHTAPILYLPHGGGPMPLMGDASHAGMIAFWKAMAARFPKPDAIIMISAHWEASTATVNAATSPGMLYDYYNFPAETYEYQYPAPGNPTLAKQVIDLFGQHSISATAELDRGYDHGVFVPMMLMYPEADIPCVQLSLLENLHAQQHLDMGKALASLRSQNILVIGSLRPAVNLRLLLQNANHACAIGIPAQRGASVTLERNIYCHCMFVWE